jgi:hypothetical protein
MAVRNQRRLQWELRRDRMLYEPCQTLSRLMEMIRMILYEEEV